MSPRVKRTRAELPKTVVQKGVVGCFPLGSWSLTALYSQRCSSILGFRDAETTLLYKSAPQAQLVVSAKKRETVALNGRLFNGFSDAFYRGQLPEVILVCPPDAQRVNFVNDLADYLEQLAVMGYFSAKLPPEKVALYVPCFVLLGHGVWFSRMMAMLAAFLKDLKYHALPLPTEVQQAILERFVRGSAPDMDWAASEEAKHFNLTPLPETFRIGGGSSVARHLIENALASYGWTVQIEDSANNPAERLELQSAAWRLSSIVIPGLAEQKLLSKTDVKKLTPLIQQAILSIGQHRRAFAQSEGVKHIILKAKTKGETFGSPLAEQGLLKGLSAYASALGLTQEREIFDRLAERVSGGNTEI